MQYLDSAEEKVVGMQYIDSAVEKVVGSSPDVANRALQAASTKFTKIRRDILNLKLAAWAMSIRSRPGRCERWPL